MYGPCSSGRLGSDTDISNGDHEVHQPVVPSRLDLHSRPQKFGCGNVEVSATSVDAAASLLRMSSANL